MPYNTSLVNNIHLSVSGVDETYNGADDWDSIGPDGNYLPGTRANGAGGDVGGQPAEKVWITYTVRWYEPPNADQYAVGGDTSAFEQYTQADDPNFFNNCIVEIANAANVIKESFTGSVTAQSSLNGFVQGIGGPIGDVLDLNNLSAWSRVVDQLRPGSAMGNGAQAGTGEVGNIYGATPVERIIPGTDKKEWFVWTAFRVRPQVVGQGISAVGDPYPLGYGFLRHTLTEGQYKAWNGLTNNSQYNNTQELPSDEDPEAELVETFVDMGKLLTNLPMTKYARQNNDGSRGPKWRDGLLHTWENTPATEGLKSGIPYGFRFHWNPAGWSQSASMIESINPEQFAASNPQQVPLLGGFSNISVTIQLNRMFDLQGNSNERNNGDLKPTDELRISRRASELLALGEYNYPGSGIGVPFGFDSYTGIQDKFTDLKNLLRQGTLYDLDYLFAVTNGTNYGSYHVNYTPNTGGNDLINPSYKMTESSVSRAENGIPSRGFAGGSPDYGFISAKPVRIWLGPHITFVGRIQSYSIQHLMFTEYMIPTVTQVALTLTRSVTMGSTFDESVKLANEQTATSNADTTPTGDPNAEEPD